MSQSALDRALALFGSRIVATHSHRGDDTIVIEGPKVRDVMQLLRDDPALSFDFLVDLTAMDYLGYPEDSAAQHPGGATATRMETVYHLRSSKHGHRLRVRARLLMPDDGSLPVCESVVPLWPGANWQEREAYDLLGVRFLDHPDLRRILMYPEFVGHPLRKDYPKDKRQPLVRRDPDPVMQGEG